MIRVRPAAANRIFADAVKRADGEPITSGTVNLYVVAVTGTNAGEWFKHSDQTWNASETICLAATHLADGHWYGDVHADCWVDGERYLVYLRESDDLHIPVSYEVEAAYAIQTDTSGHVKALDDAGSELASASSVGTLSGSVDAIKDLTDKLTFMIEVSGPGYRYTTKALEQAPAGGGGTGGGMPTIGD